MLFRSWNALHYKKPAFWVVAASVAVCVVVAVCFLTNPEHETMKWAKNLRVDDVVRVELTIMPQATDKQYKDFNADEIAEAVALINKSSGRPAGSLARQRTNADDQGLRQEGRRHVRGRRSLRRRLPHRVRFRTRRQGP